ncbi:hypothetical protein A8C32_17515 [Flavivirga aquatica]|uniref:EF-hand domain-containing protein n=1 Tax=Flavivirga aquatica TaxID=1849968 RepID=A0A1E5T884_9FLAO|nr:EF-hand domain-containing protein [Flavivirga aquatica]OEK07595.1 hypothetical protein A8C32_17515 [Flavivirga aquatica]
MRKLRFGLVIILFISINSFGQSNKRPNRQEPPSVEELFKEMDTNEDGKLALDEIKGPLKAHFSKVDANNDGFITQEELVNSPKPKGHKPKKD